MLTILRHRSRSLLKCLKHTFQRITSFPGNKLSKSIKCLDDLHPETLEKAKEIRISFGKSKETKQVFNETK